MGIPPLAFKQFLLAAGEQGEGENTSGLADSFAGATIIPSQSIGSDWEEVGAAPAVYLRGPRSGILGGFSVNSALTDASLIRTPISSGGVGSGLGGVNTWHPSRDSNVMRGRDSKLRATSTICIKIGEEICFGFMGMKRFCRAAGCRIRAHQKKFDMKCKQGWFMTSKGKQGTGSPAAFITPYLDTAKVSEDVLHTLGNAFVRKTTKEWEEFIQDTQEEWEELLLQHPLGEITEHSSMEEEEEDSVESVEGKIHLTSPPELFAWKDKRAFPIPGLKQTDSKPSEEVEELQAAIKDLYTYLVDVSNMAREDSYEVFDHMSAAIQEVVDAINRVNTRGNRWRDLIGDVRALWDDSGDSMFTLVGAVQDLMTPPHTQVIDKGDEVERVKSLMVEIKEDMIYNFTLLNDRVKALERQANTAQGVGAS